MPEAAGIRATGMFHRLRIILEMIKFSHTIFALPFALLAACLASVRAEGWNLLDLVGLVLCMVFARSAAMGFNRWADRELDAKNPRTQSRALPAGILTPRQVLAFVAACSLGFIASTFVFVAARNNFWPPVLSVPVLAFLFGYSYSKRFTVLAHVWLGTALALAPIAAWIAIRGQIELAPLLLGLAIVCWVSGFDILYACQDIAVDRRLDLRSLPARLGMDGAFLVARLCHGAMLAVLVLFGLYTPELGGAYWTALGLAALLLFVEHWLVRHRDLGRINVAFLHVNGVISIGLFFAALFDLY